ncbi:MAG: ATP-binding protein [Patescibacteria group bacterium]|nr:ATP-binding protein [Patescibacteria group bacterium]
MDLSNTLLSFLIIIICLTLFLGFITLVTNEGWKKNNSLNFSYLAFSIAVWQAVNLLTLINQTYNLNLLWARLTYTLGALVLYLLVHFIIYFPQKISENIKIMKFVDVFCLLISIFISIIALSPSFIGRIYFQNNILTFEYGQLLPVFLIGILINLIIFISLILINYKKSNEESKKKIKWLFAGAIISSSVIIVTDVILPAFFGTTFEFLSNFGYVSSVILVSFTAYAIIKYELFDIKVILTETALGVVVLALLAQLIFSETIEERFIDFIILTIVCYGGYLLIKSVKREIEFRKQLEETAEQLAHANEHLKELDKMKTEFVSLASHELLTPVSAIEGYLSMMLDEKLARIDDPKAIHYMDRVYASAKRLARLVTDMLNVSRIEEGRLLVEKKEVSLTGVIEQTIDELKFKAEERKQKIVFQNANHWETFGDSDKIKEILVNLIGNSIKYSKEPGEIQLLIETVPTEQVQATWSKIEGMIKDGPLDDQEAIKSAVDERLKRLVGPRQILIHVKDQGIGIPKEELPKLFKKFHRVGDYTTAESQGTGLGLYITRALVELHHGRVWADSEGQGKGSTFTFSLPEAKVQKEIQDLEAQVPKNKEELKPLAQPPKEAEEL